MTCVLGGEGWWHACLCVFIGASRTNTMTTLSRGDASTKSLFQSFPISWMTYAENDVDIFTEVITITMVLLMLLLLLLLLLLVRRDLRRVDE